ncbi:MAG: hypothetical protein K6G84_08815 [Lachnospiraceae bacterium]|nr:hypothetical protein [Lachnospiraceae bacterium]
MTERTTAIGIDLRDDYSEISYCIKEESNVVTYKAGEEEENFEIPTVACKLPGDGEWFFGLEAIATADEYGLSLVTGLINKAIIGKRIFANDSETIDPVRLLGMYISYLMELPKEVSKYDIASIVVTVDKVAAEIPFILDRALESYKKDVPYMRYVSHAESFFYYALSHPIELWRDGVLLYDYTDEHFRMSRLLIDTSLKPAVVQTAEQLFEDMIPFSEDNSEVYDNMFREITETEIMKGRVSAVYLTGSVFKGRWAEKTFRFLCSRSRVFAGQNLYTKGACYAAADLAGWTRLGSRYIFMDETRLHANIALRAESEGKEMLVDLVSAGVSWYDVNASFECMLGTDRKIDLVIKSCDDGEERNVVIRCDWIPERPERTTRVYISLYCPNEGQLSIRVTDMGFGEIFQSAGMTKEELIEIF